MTDRSSVLQLLLAVWLFAVFAPPTFILVSEDKGSFVSYSLNEEEQPEQEKKDTCEEKMIPESPETTVFVTLITKNSTADNYFFGSTKHSPEIVLPPPENHG